MIEAGKIKGLTCLTTLLELRYLLRRKKEYNEEQVETYISQIMSILEVIVPDEISLLRANRLQSENLLDPFDTILLSFSIGVRPATFISRDTDFLKIAKRFIEVAIPEDFSF
ncbi:PIN domain-containing protein [bacterium]|nr:PIN domain-containing protein [bacterium]